MVGDVILIAEWEGVKEDRNLDEYIKKCKEK